MAGGYMKSLEKCNLTFEPFISLVPCLPAMTTMMHHSPPVKHHPLMMMPPSSLNKPPEIAVQELVFNSYSKNKLINFPGTSFIFLVRQLPLALTSEGRVKVNASPT
jgi:hypothetical protein